MTVHIRPATPADFAAVNALNNLVNPEQVSALASFEARERARRPDLTFGRLLAERAGEVLGVALYAQHEWTTGEGRLLVNVSVHPERQGEGIGRALYASLLEAVAPHRPQRLLTQTIADRPRALRFLAERGWQEVARERPSALTLAGADLSGLDPALARLEAQGYRVATFAELLETDPQAEAKFYTLDLDADRDVPMPEGETMRPPPPERYWHTVRSNPHHDPALWFVAVQGGGYAALSQLNHSDLPGVLKTDFTGTGRAHRRRGLALALKLRALQAARELGAREVRTVNDARNRPMLALNERLGFTERPARLSYALELGGEKRSG